jgi:hypothetical protein
MNSRQACVLVLGIMIFVLMALYPPVNRVLMVKIVNDSGEVQDQEVVTSEFQGYQYYFSLGPGEHGYEFRVATWILGAQCLLLLVLIRVFMVAFRHSKPGIPTGKVFHKPNALE